MVEISMECSERTNRMRKNERGRPPFLSLSKLSTPSADDLNRRRIKNNTTCAKKQVGAKRG